MPDFGLNWREFTMDGTLYRHRMEGGNYEVQRWVKRGNAVGAWVPCRRPIQAPKLGYQEVPH